MTASITSRLMAVHLGLDPRDPHVRCIGNAVIVQNDRMDADVYMLDAEGGISHQKVHGDAYALWRTWTLQAIGRSWPPSRYACSGPIRS